MTKTTSLTLGGGCFWCTQAVFERLDGVLETAAGYMGGQASTAHYDTVCQGDTGHIEVVKIIYDEGRIATQALLDVFFAIHNPSTKNRQGGDIGRQYASVIFYQDDTQKRLAIDAILARTSQGLEVVTEVLPAVDFYPAEEYHQAFFTKNPTQGYCKLTIPPKLDALARDFPHLLKDPV